MFCPPSFNQVIQARCFSVKVFAYRMFVFFPRNYFGLFHVYICGLILKVDIEDTKKQSSYLSIYLATLIYLPFDLRRPGVNNSRHFSTARNLSGQKTLRWVISQFLYVKLFVTVCKLKFLTVDLGAFCNLLKNQPMFTFCCKQKTCSRAEKKMRKEGEH